MPPLPAAPGPAPAPAPAPGAAPIKPPSLNPHPNAYLQGLMANWAARLHAAQLRLTDESLLFIAAVMQLWGDNPHHPIVPVGVATALARCNWVYDQFVDPNGPHTCNIDANDAGPLAPLRAGNALTLQSFNACFEYIVGLITNNNL
jgi:hypothetical protein